MSITDKQYQALEAIEQHLARIQDSKMVLANAKAPITRALCDALAEHRLIKLTPAKPARTLVSLTLLGKAVLARRQKKPLTAQYREVAELCDHTITPGCHASLRPDGEALVVILTFALPA